MGVLGKEIEATYEVLAKMGAGGMGAVYKVRHRFFDEIRVVKVMAAELDATPELKERFLHEAKRGKQLRHPNLAEVMEFSITAEGTSYIVMEYIEGVTLREVVARNGGPLDYRAVVPIAEQVLDALAFLHSRKFIHRDISSDNIMLTHDDSGEPRVKLIDLGIAKSLEVTSNLTQAGKFLGKVRYASPEHFTGQMDGRSDLYSFGIVLYEVLTGAFPITGDTNMAIVAGHMTRPPKPFEQTDPEGRVPPAIRAAVMKALEKRPDDRFQDAAAFAAALRAALPESEPLPATERIFTRPSGLRPVPVPVPRSGPKAAVTQPEVTVRTEPPAPAVPLEPTVLTDAARGAGSPTRPGADWRVRPTYVIAGIAVLVLIAGLATVFWSRQPAPKPPPPKPAVSVPTASNTMAGTTLTVEPPKPVEKGQLLINALPWGVVSSVTNASGVEQLSAAAETPVLLSLPAGDYKVRLTNPNSNRSVLRDATVKPNGLARCEAELDRVDAGAYVDRIGVGP